MKWIGQHIWSFISRFRSDVYLEDLSTSSETDILVVDSDGKITKNSGAGDDMAFTLTGDSGSNQTIDDGSTLDIAGGNAISTVVGATDTVTVNHDDTSSQASVDNSGRAFVQDITLDTYGHVTGITSATDADTYSGTVTSVTLQDGDEGQIQSTGGFSATIDGAGPISTAVSSTTLTISIADGSDSDKGILEVATTGEATTGTDTGRAVTPAGVKAHIESRKVHELTAPTAALAMNSQKITGLDTPTSSGDAATKGYVDGTAGRRACFRFKGYGTSDGTNYDMSVELTDNQAPFQHDTSTGSDGLTAQTTSAMIRAGGIVMPHTGVLKKFTGWVTSQGTGTVDVGIFKVTPVDNNAGNLTPALLVNEQITAAGNTKMRSFSETSSFDAGFTAGDIIYSAVNGGTASKLWYMNSMLEVEWS